MTRFSKDTLESPTGAKLALYAWDNVKNTKGVVHINHGMSEHSARYDRFATALNAAGYMVYAHDHRGHGKTTAPDAHQGLFARTDGAAKVIADVNAVNSHLRETFNTLPIILFGHSMGAIIGITYCIQHSRRIDGAALWNSGVDGGALLFVYRTLLAIERMFKGSDVPSAVARKLTFETWNKEFKPNRTEYHWLSRDEAEVDKYIADPLCGFDTCNGLWRDLTDMIKAASSDYELKKIRGDLPFNLVAGGKDPCSVHGKAVERLANRLRALNVSDVTCAIHPDNRHETLNELNRDQATADFIKWLDERFT